jgi:hypothetical protein
MLACSVLDGMFVGEVRTADLQTELIGAPPTPAPAAAAPAPAAATPKVPSAAPSRGHAPPAPSQAASGVYRNPELVWWQPLDDWMRKVKQAPQHGQVGL